MKILKPVLSSCLSLSIVAGSVLPYAPNAYAIDAAITEEAELLEKFELSLKNQTADKPLSTEEKSDTFRRWIEALRVSTFEQGSANPKSPYYVNHPLDDFSLQGQTVYLHADDSPKFKFVARNKITLEIVGPDEKTIRYINPEGQDLRFLYGDKGDISKGRHFSLDQLSTEAQKALYTFHISAQGQTIHSFKNNLQSAVFLDQYLVFLEPARIINGRNIVNLSFIDLDFFNSAIAKTVLPIFRRPLEISAEHMAKPENLKLEYTSEGIRIGNKVLSKNDLDLYANLQRLSWNVTSSVTDPEFYEQMAPVINETFENFQEGIDAVPVEAKAQAQRAGAADELFKAFLKTVKSRAQLRAHMGPVTPTHDARGKEVFIGPFKGHEEEAKVLEDKATADMDKVILENLTRAEVWDRGVFEDPINLSPEEKVAFRKQAAAALDKEIPQETKDQLAKAKEFAAILAQDKDFQATLVSYDTTIARQNKLFSRLGILWARMNFPQPLGAPKIQKALALVASNLSDAAKWDNGSIDSGARWKEAFLKIMGKRTAQIATATAVGGVLGLMYPQEAGLFYLSALDVGRAVQDGVLGWGASMWNHTAAAWEASWAWLNPSEVYDKFLAPDKIGKLAIGVSAIGAALAFSAGAIHSLVNSVHYYKAMSKGTWREYREMGLSAFNTFRISFPEFLNNEKKQYYELLGKAEAGRQGTKAQEDMTEEKKAEVMKKVDSIFEQIKEEEKENESLLSSMKDWPLIKKFFNRPKKDIETFGEALRHFFIGYSSWTHSTKVFGKMWNPWFLSRNFWLNPRSWFTMIAYPNYFNRAVKGAKGGHFATVFNGGKRPIYETAGFFRMAGVENVDELMKELVAWEREIIPAEQLIHRAALKATYLRFVEMSANDPELIEFVKGGPFEQLNLDNYKRLDKLERKMRIYFNAYFTETFKRSMQAFLKKRMNVDPDKDISDEVLKVTAIQTNSSVKLTGDSAIDEKEAADIVASIDIKAVEEYSQHTAFDFVEGFWQRRKLKHFEKVDQTMNPQFKYALNRYLKAEEKMEDPEAMARATRQMMIGMITDKPMELLFTFLLATGIDQGLLKPLQDNMFDENSWFHLSRYLFWNGYFVGILTGLLAEVWLKIQMDARMDDLNELDHVPSPEEAKKGYMHWLRKSMFRKSNTLWENYKFTLKMSFMNMQAYLLTAIVTSMIFMGRFDLENFITVYIGALIPMGALHNKIESGFEASNKFDLGRFPKEAWSDPRVQEYRAKKMSARRVWVNLFNNFWTNIVGNVEVNWLMMTSNALSPRTFLRMIFGGYLPSELIVNHVFRPVGEVFGGALKPITNACESFLLNNYTDAIKVPPAADAVTDAAAGAATKGN